MKPAAMLRLFLAAMAAFSFCASSLAYTPDPAYDRFRHTVTGNRVLLSYGSNGTALSSTSGMTGLGSSSGALISRGASVATKYGPLGFNVSQFFSSAALARNFLKVVGGPLALGLLAAPYIYDWMTDAGLSVDESGNLVQRDPSVCTVSPCVEYSYKVTTGGVTYDTGWQYGKGAGCEAAVALLNGPAGGPYSYVLYGVINDGTTYDCSIGSRTDSSTGAYSTGGKLALLERTVSPSVPQYLPISVEDALDRLLDYPRTAQEHEGIAGEVDDLNDEPEPDPEDKPQASNPGKTDPKTTTTSSTDTDGNQENKETNCVMTAVVNPTDASQMTLEEQCVTVTSSTDPSGKTTTKTTTTADQPPDAAEPTEEEEPFKMPCGIDGTPPCAVKVDETGMPDANSLDPKKGADALKDIEDFLDDPYSVIPEFPSITWDFALPSACGVIPTPAFEPYFSSIDVCQFQPTFHDIMNVVWMLGGLFGAISLFMKSALAD